MDNLTIVCFREPIFGDAAALGKMVDDFATFAGSKILVFESKVPHEKTLLRAVNIVAGLQARGLNSVSLCGADLDCVRASEQGVARVDSSMFRLLLKQDVAPVVVPVTHDTEGGLLSSEYADVAMQLALAMSWHYNVLLIMCDAELLQLIRRQHTMPVLTEAEYKALKAENKLSDELLDRLYAMLAVGLQNIFVVAPENLGTVKGTALTL